MKVVTAAQMREAEEQAAGIGLPPQVLMENAGLAVAREVAGLWPEVTGKHILVLIGPGNNGGDGLVAARHLHDWGAQVHLYLCSPRSQSQDRNFKLTQERKMPTVQATKDPGFAALEGILSSAHGVIDALLGTGKIRPLEGVFQEALGRVRGVKETHPDLMVIALDLPSGLDADTGTADGACLRADVTITLGYPKLGLFAGSGPTLVGNLKVVDIGIPPTQNQTPAPELITAQWVRSVLPHRPPEANKGSFGRVLVVAGSINYIGAAYLACSGAARVGAGLTTLATPKSLEPILAAKLTETTYFPLPESEAGVLAPEAAQVLFSITGYDVWVVGCGLGQNPPAIEFIKTCLLSPSAPTPALVLDADALNTLAQVTGWWQKLQGEAILTPHPGEMSRLTDTPIAEIQAHRLEAPRQAAREWGKVVVLKGAHTVVAAPDGRARLSSVANPGLASAGTGDVLAGAIGGLLGQGLEPFDAAACGVYLHAAAAELVRGELGEAGMLASDLLPALPRAIKAIKEDRSPLL
ncbi:MAG: NAD(P)H-hydrate dehydratase [Dehalococcoidia bacterium]